MPFAKAQKSRQRALAAEERRYAAELLRPEITQNGRMQMGAVRSCQRFVKLNFRELVALLSIMLLSAQAFAQRYSPSEDFGPEGSDYWYENEFPLAFLAIMIQFVAPYFIAKRLGDDSGFLYWKWWFIFIGGFAVVAFAQIRETMAFVLVNVAIAVYGLLFTEKKQ